MPDDLAFEDIIFHFISNNFLVFLPSIKEQRDKQAVEKIEVQPALAELPVDIFREILEVLIPAGWLNWPELMLQTAPIRAAAAAFRIDL
jgi:hypothetical protein